MALRGIWDPLKQGLPKGVLKQEPSGIEVTTSFGVNNFGNNKVMKVTFFSKCAKFHLYFGNAITISEKVFSYEDNCVWPCWGISLSSDQKTCDRLSTCSKTVPRCQIWLKQMFFNRLCLRLIENWDKSNSPEASALFGTR